MRPQTVQYLCFTMMQYEGEEDLVGVMRLIDTELSEPYSVFTYRWSPSIDQLHARHTAFQLQTALPGPVT